ncbi:MAG: cupin domain-containing protein [Vicinamibacteria bacterium]|nr:cupin domain-containing protein [Vicinamibacteria bacterium]
MTAPEHPRGAELIRELNLLPHPEGGFYSQIFRSSSLVATSDGRSDRLGLTTICFLLPDVQPAASRGL